MCRLSTRASAVLPARPDQIAKVASEYRVYYKRISSSDSGYVMDHTSILYLMDPNGKFVGLIAYQEKYCLSDRQVEETRGTGRVFVTEAARAGAISVVPKYKFAS